MDAIEYPTVQVGTEKIPLKYRFGDIKRLKAEADIDFFQVRAIAIPNPMAEMDYILTMLSYGFAHQVAITPAELADKIDWAQFAECAFAISQSIKKASDQINATTAAMRELVQPQTIPAIQ